ncbi:MAG: BCCT family transporter [Gammaproteobacteria bacterium]|nr:BCCT family transporter [Gammaproteobacteria bacterium]
MTEILSVAIIVTTLTSLFIVARWRNLRCEGPLPASLFTFIAILFTSGLDVGLIMFPMVDFESYAGDPAYDFANPLAFEFGFWGFLVWGFYFLTTFYFCIVEPKLQLFEIPAVKFTNNVVIIGTCAFTGFLFLQYLPSYIEGISDLAKFGLVAAVVLFAALSSTHIRFVAILSVSSTWLFFALIAGIWLVSGMGIGGLTSSMSNLDGYFGNIHRFVLPVTDYHQFYLYWWFAWSIMIGQFVSRFVGGLKTWQLLVALLVVPSIPIAIWFSVLYYYFDNGIAIPGIWRVAMIVVGVIFVVNSLDSLMRLYTQNLGLTVARLGTWQYVAGNWIALYGLVLLYQFTPLEIEWVGIVVIGLYAAVYALVFKRRGELAAT